jgi:O-succinylbenzoic acid--CoA ligase
MSAMECPIAYFSRTTPDQIALVTDTGFLTYQQLHQQINKVCAALKELRVDHASRCAFIATNTWQTTTLFFALLRLQAISCPLSFRLPKGQREECKAAMGVTHDLCVEPLFSSAKEEETTRLSEEQYATFVQTSGSERASKIAVHTLGNHYYSALGAARFLRFSSQERYLLSLPLFHVGGIAILFRCFYQGATLVISKYPLGEAIVQHKVTYLSCVPTQLVRLLKGEGIDQIAKQLKCLLMGGSALSVELCGQALQRGFPLFSSYGMTETSSVIAAEKVSSPLHTISVGSPLDFREMKRSPDGEILVRGKTLFAGYLSTENGIEKMVDQEGWFATKDIGICAPDGRWEICGRRDRMFISGGENIHPEEIERALSTLPRVLEARVCPIEDPEFGKRPIAFLEQEGAPYTLEEVCAHLEGKIASFKRPVQLHPLQKEGNKTWKTET